MGSSFFKRIIFARGVFLLHIASSGNSVLFVRWLSATEKSLQFGKLSSDMELVRVRGFGFLYLNVASTAC
jgi:hypothetical protein